MSVGLRNKRIDLIRGVSILLVPFHHFNIAYRLDDTALARAFGWEAVRAVARNGNYGDTMFFVVSGFLITLNARRRWGGLGRVGARAFYGLRAARILPCLLLLLLVVDVLAPDQCRPDWKRDSVASHATNWSLIKRSRPCPDIVGAIAV